MDRGLRQIWLNGLAGTGKSTIAQTIAERVSLMAVWEHRSSVQEVPRIAVTSSSSSQHWHFSLPKSTQPFCPCSFRSSGPTQTLSTSRSKTRCKSFWSNRPDPFFVYAVAMVKFLDHHLQDPSDQLATIMGSLESTTCEGGTELKVYNNLDSPVLSATVLVANPLSLSVIATLLDFHHNQVQHLLKLIQLLPILPEDLNYPIQPFHKSFSNSLTDPI